MRPFFAALALFLDIQLVSARLVARPMRLDGKNLFFKHTVEDYDNQGQVTSLTFEGRSSCQNAVLLDQDTTWPLISLECKSDIVRMGFDRSFDTFEVEQDLVSGAILVIDPDYACETENGLGKPVYRFVDSYSVKNKTIQVSTRPASAFSCWSDVKIRMKQYESLEKSDVRRRIIYPDGTEEVEYMKDFEAAGYGLRRRLELAKSVVLASFGLNFDLDSNQVQRPSIDIFSRGLGETQNQIAVTCETCYTKAALTLIFELDVTGQLFYCQGFFNCEGPRVFLDHFLVALDGRVEGRATVKAGLSYQYTLNRMEQILGQLPLGAISIPSPVPIFIRPTFKLAASVEFNVNAEANLAISAAFMYNVRIGFEYDRASGKTGPLMQFTRSFVTSYSQVGEAGVSVRCAITPQFELLVYEIMPVALQIEPYVSANAGLSAQNPDCRGIKYELFAGADAWFEVGEIQLPGADLLVFLRNWKFGREMGLPLRLGPSPVSTQEPLFSGCLSLAKNLTIEPLSELEQEPEPLPDLCSKYDSCRDCLKNIGCRWDSNTTLCQPVFNNSTLDSACTVSESALRLRRFYSSFAANQPATIGWSGGRRQGQIAMALVDSDSMEDMEVSAGLPLSPIDNRWNFEWRIPPGIDTQKQYRLILSSTTDRSNFVVSDPFQVNASSIVGEVKWKTGNWSICDVKCGGGNQTRTVECTDSIGQVVSDDQCLAFLVKPETNTPCNTLPCSSLQCGWNEDTALANGGCKCYQLNPNSREETCAYIEPPGNPVRCSSDNCCIPGVNTSRSDRPCVSSCSAARYVPMEFACSSPCNGTAYVSFSCRAPSVDDPSTSVSCESTFCRDNENRTDPSGWFPCNVDAPACYGIMQQYYEAFTPWSECTKPCSGGTQNRTKACFNLNGQQVDDSFCPKIVDQTEFQQCNTASCLDFQLAFRPLNFTEAPPGSQVQVEWTGGAYDGRVSIRLGETELVETDTNDNAVKVTIPEQAMSGRSQLQVASVKSPTNNAWSTNFTVCDLDLAQRLQTETCVTCHEECLGGCNGLTPRDCQQCRNLKYQDSCVQACPAGTTPDASKLCV